MNSSREMYKRVENDLKPHNVETIKNILEIYKTSNKCCAIQATGTGKTFLILRLLEIYNDEGKVAVIFAPNREIIKQTKKRMKKFGLNNAIFYTYQKLARMTNEEISAMEFDLIVCDELHRTGAKTWGQKFEVLVNSHPDSKVFGVTATPLRCTDGRDMAEEYFDGNKACDISLAEALVREIIPVMPLYVSALYTFEEEYQNMSDKIEKGNNSVEEKAELQKELLAAKQQLEKANGVPEIIKKYITNYNGKYLVFCKDKKHLYAMKDVVIGWFREAGYNGKIFEYPYYSDSSAVRKNLENFENNKEEGLKLLFIIDKLNEGLHLEEVHGCILLRTTVSNIIYYQQIGRAIDAGSTEQRVILDLVSNFNSLKSFNLKKELAEKVQERRNGNFSDCSAEFEFNNFDVIDCVQECIDVFINIDAQITNGWSEEEIQILVEKYPYVGISIKELLLNKSESAIYNMAYSLGLQKNPSWSDEEIEILKLNYPKYGRHTKNLLPQKTESSILGMASKLNLKTDSTWTTEEIDILKKYYPIEGSKVCNRLKNRTSTQCSEKAVKLNISYINPNKWTEEEKRFLIQNYGEIGGSKCALILGKTNKSVNKMAAKLNLSANFKWTDEEIKILKEKYPIMGKKCSIYLPNRSEATIVAHANKLGIFSDYKSIKSKSKYKYVTFNKNNNNYMVAMNINGKRKYFGSFEDEDEAGRVALEKAKEYGKPI